MAQMVTDQRRARNEKSTSGHMSATGALAVVEATHVVVGDEADRAPKKSAGPRAGSAVATKRARIVSSGPSSLSAFAPSTMVDPFWARTRQVRSSPMNE